MKHILTLALALAALAAPAQIFNYPAQGPSTAAFLTVSNAVGTNMVSLSAAQTITGAKTFNAAIALGSGSGAIVGGLADISLTTAGGSILSYGSGGTRGVLTVAPGLTYAYGGSERLRVANTTGTITFGTDANSRPTLTHLSSTNVLRISTYGLADGLAVELLQMSAPASPSGNSARLYSKDDAGTARIYGMAEDGTEFLLTPHSKLSPGKAVDGNDPDPVVFHESNAFLGRERFIHITAAVREIEKLTGKRFIFDRDIPNQDWNAAQARNKKQADEARSDDEKAVAAWLADSRTDKGPRPNVRSAFKPKPNPFKP